MLTTGFWGPLEKIGVRKKYKVRDGQCKEPGAMVVKTGVGIRVHEEVHLVR